MRALVSGQAGVAIVFDGDRTVSIDVECEHPVVRDPNEWPYLLEGADDAYELNDVSEQQVVRELDLAWRKDRALHLVLILLERDTRQETRKESAELLEILVADERVFRHILNRLHVAPLPATADLEGAVRITGKRFPRVDAVLQEISEGQATIALTRQAWELLPADLFGSALAKESFGFKAVEVGLFEAMSSSREIDLKGFSHEDLEVMKRWRREIKSLESSLETRRLNVQGDGDTALDSGHGAKKTLTRRVIAIGAAACIALIAVLATVLNTRTVEASSLVRLGAGEPGFQVVHAALNGLQQELYGRTLVPYSLRNSSKKTAERLFVSGEVDLRSGRLENAVTEFHESNATYPTIAARLNEAVALLNTSKLSEAERVLKATLREAGQPVSQLLRAAILTNLGHVYRTQGRFDDADQSYSSALEIDRNGGFKGGEAADLNNLALVLLSRGKPVKALEGFKQALSVAEGAGVDSVAADCHLNIGRILSEFGRSSEAEQNLQLASAYYERQESLLGQASYNLAYGQYLYQLGINRSFYGGTLPQREADQGVVYYNRALDLYKSVSNKSGQARARMGIGAGLLEKGESRDALDQYKEALRLSHEIGDLPSEEAAFRQMSAWYSVAKSYDLAVQNAQRALGIARNIGDRGGECISLEGLALTMTYAGRADLALEYISEAVEASLKSGDAFTQAAAYDNLGFLLYKSFNKNAEALTALERAYSLYSEVDSPLRDGTMLLMNYVRAHAASGELNRKQPPPGFPLQ